MNYTIGEKKGFMLVGMKYYGNNSNEIGKLWDNFVARIGEIRNRVDVDIHYGYDTWTAEINTNGKFTYYAAVKVADDSCVPAGMDLIKIPANKYAIFKIENYNEYPNYDNIVQHIYKEVLPKEGLIISSNYDFEETGKKDMYFHVPIK
ncbi:effector binding domain-containing protein [Clostridium sp. 'deep sea']|uniref:GyrI-like domain-containing protein n=1 Tax=Clostridium sp. 'deep sea' TaxID=2779445 RepID=UPI00189664ED|nr:effector binding domain-containing protein [Clostridium sp. 'deep sea']QOR34573.1 effector binding domain-containing protein [Clostridium sp. 'deep sea']